MDANLGLGASLEAGKQRVQLVLGRGVNLVGAVVQIRRLVGVLLQVEEPVLFLERAEERENNEG